jgi:hypothetical protein
MTLHHLDLIGIKLITGTLIQKQEESSSWDQLQLVYKVKTGSHPVDHGLG